MPLARTLFNADHDAFRETCRTFFAKHVTPNNERWAKDGIVDREVWREAGAAGPARHRRRGEVRRRRPSRLPVQRGARRGADPRPGIRTSGFAVHNDLILPYLERLATDEQKQRWLPGFCTGDIITAIAMSEPGAGSRPAGNPHHGRSRRRLLRAQRAEDLYQQRHSRRSGHRRRQDRSGPGRRTGCR